MKTMNKGLQIVGAAFVLLLAAGCSTEVLTAEYIMPPNMISDVKSIDVIEIVPEITLSGNAFENKDKAFVAGALQQSMASRLCQGGYIKTVDYVWGNPDGASDMEDVLARKEHMHGYTRHATDPVSSRAKLEMKLKAAVNTSTAKQNVSITLQDVPYKEGRNGRVPTSSPDTARIVTEKVSVPMDVFSISGTGALSVTLTDKSGNVVYEKEFPSLESSFSTSTTNHGAPPTSLEVISTMILPAIETIAADISPHKENRTLQINEDGSKESVLLLKAMAFTEAISAIDNIEDDKKSAADYENLGVAYEVIGDYDSAKEFYEAALERKNDSGIATIGKERILDILKAKEELRKTKAKKTETQFKSSEFEP